MLLTDARRHARVGHAGELIPLAQQDRTLWDAGQIAEGIALLTAALQKGAVGQYQLQAAISAVHSEATRAEDTDWPQILALYDLLKRMTNNPVVMLNRAVALAMVRGAATGLQELERLDGDGRLEGHHRVHAVRAHLLEMAGDCEAAAGEYRIAAVVDVDIPRPRQVEIQTEPEFIARVMDIKLKIDHQRGVRADHSMIG